MLVARSIPFRLVIHPAPQAAWPTHCNEALHKRAGARHAGRMTRYRWILATLLVLFAIAMIYAGNSPELSSRYATAMRNSGLSDDAKDLVMGGLVVVIGGYLAWFFFLRRD